MKTHLGNDATYEDLVALPDEGRDWELVDGELIRRASPRPAHGFSHGRVLTALAPAHGSRAPTWWILIEPDWWITPRRVLKPDLAGWRLEHVPSLDPKARVMKVRPDWVCEILSPGHHGYDRQRKRAMYAEAGVPWYWLVDPEAGVLEVQQLVDGRWVVDGTFTEETVALSPFTHLVDVGALFLPRPPMVHDDEPVERF